MRLRISAALLALLPLLSAAGEMTGTNEAQALETIPVQLPPSQEPAEPARKAEPVVIETVVVTGEKLGRSEQDTMTSVSVFGRRNIEDQGDQTLGELLRRAANTSSNEEGNISIRGISQSGAGGGEGAPLISVQVDGVTLDKTSQQGAVDELFDVDQVEVLRGAQSTSQGRNALGGAVIVNTREPTRSWEWRVRGQLRERDGRVLAAAGGGPLSESLAFRLVGTYERDDGYITHLPDDDEDFARMQKTLLRGRLAYAPLTLPGFTSLLTLGANRSDGQPDYNMERGTSGTTMRRTSTVNEPTRDLTHSRLASWRNRLTLGEHSTLTALTGYMKTDQDYLRDFDGLDEDGGTNPINNDGRNLTQELRLNIDQLGWATGVIGIYGGRFREHGLTGSNDLHIPVSSVAPVPFVGDVVEVGVDFDSEMRKQARNIALFTEFDIALPYQLTATLGLRYDHESLDARNRFETPRGEAFVVAPDGIETIPLAGDVLAQLLALQPGIDVLPLLVAAGFAPATNGFQGGKTRYSALLPKLGLRYAITPQWSVFASYAEAYRAGGVDVDSSSGEAVAFDPEFTQNYETGLRATLFGSRLELGANLFYTDWKDQQVPVLRGLFSVTQNAARSRLYGAESSLGWRPLASLRLNLSLGFVRTEFLDYRDGDEDYSGNRFIFAPRSSASVGAVWRPAGGFVAAVNLAHRSMSYTRPSNLADERSDARQLLDARLGWERGGYGVFVTGRNLLDQDYISETYQFREGYIGAATPRGYGAYGAPRTLGIQMEARF